MARLTTHETIATPYETSSSTSAARAVATALSARTAATFLSLMAGVAVCAWWGCWSDADGSRGFFAGYVDGDLAEGLRGAKPCVVAIAAATSMAMVRQLLPGTIVGRDGILVSPLLRSSDFNLGFAD